VIFWSNPSQCMTISFCHYWFSLMLSSHDSCIDIASETVALDTPNNVAVFITDAPVKCAPMICHLSKLDKFPSFQFFHTDCHSTESLMNWHEHFRV
jgi:hypothetical protein